ncbi:MAG: 2-C-methyl-D-erythritol 4-phosphate cytidylyltransferase [Planctomycetota bacterium]|jgi:2-C-methyl-D-erythritol 4-phosphate cytidylyltransferase|nr:2-C-methyl-D-erythritol 4-phosphate cytidylyltransferase [Planctomycetota bacterium]
MASDGEEREGDVAAIVAAAGLGLRMGGPIRKPFLELAGEPLLFRVCRRLASVPGVFEIIVALHPDDLVFFQDHMEEKARECGITLSVAGGTSRAESVWNALQVVSARAEITAVHDAVRPFATTAICQEVIAAARRRGAAVPVVPLGDTPKRVEGDKVLETPRRLGMMRAQTPQAFRSDLLIEAYEYAIRTGGLSESVTDDAQLVEKMGAEVAAVYGDELNLKITSAADLRLAQVLLAAGMAE